MLVGIYRESQSPSPDGSEQSVQTEPRTLAQTEYEYILKALKETEWVVGGSKGAARMLGLKRPTLIAKMPRLIKLLARWGPVRCSAERWQTILTSWAW